MSETKFTEGEWELTESDSLEGYLSIDAPGHREIATVVTSMIDGSKQDELTANAHLIVAAPELYKMLEFINSELNGVEETIAWQPVSD